MVKDQESEGKLFRTLLSGCLICGATEFREGKAYVSVQPQKDETILFFSIDDKTNLKCGLRRLIYGNAEGRKICDLVIFYAKGSDRIICFTELKENMGDSDYAVEQVIETFNNLKAYLIGSQFIYKAFISAPSGSVPRQHQESQQKLQKAFKENNFAFNDKDSLDNFLRGITPEIGKGKSKKKK